MTDPAADHSPCSIFQRDQPSVPSDAILQQSRQRTTLSRRKKLQMTDNPQPMFHPLHISYHER